MCKVYNSVGSLTVVKSHLQKHQINEFKSLNEVIAFQKNYAYNRQQIINSHEKIIRHEKDTLHLEISQLDKSIKEEKIKSENTLTNKIENLKQKLNSLLVSNPGNFFQRIAKSIRIGFYKNKIKRNETNFNKIIANSLKGLVEVINNKNKRLHFIDSQFNQAVNEICQKPLRDIEIKKRIIDEVSNSIYGALGEQKVVKELEKLSDDYSLINNFSITFTKPIYFSQEKSYIKSIQIDHILVAPSGVFLIETKNWSENSINSLSLHSPVQQIKRTSLALYKILNQGIAKNNLNLQKHHWGNKKIAVKNLIVMTHFIPDEEFQFVKIIHVRELVGYLKYFRPTFSYKETQEITNFLLNFKG